MKICEEIEELSYEELVDKLLKLCENNAIKTFQCNFDYPLQEKIAIMKHELLKRLIRKITPINKPIET